MNHHHQVLLLVILPLPGAAEAWGTDGHRIVANVAYRLLQNRTKTIVDRILVDEKGGDSDCLTCSRLAAVANWADRVKYASAYSWSRRLHFIDIHDSSIPGGCPVTTMTAAEEARVGGDGDVHSSSISGSSSNDKTNTSTCRFEYNRDCRNDACVAGAIVNYTLQLDQKKHHKREIMSTIRSSSITNSSSNSSELIRESLMFLTHFVGDIHQPLHVSRASDYGGNTIHVIFNDTSSSSGWSSSSSGQQHFYHEQPRPLFSSHLLLRGSRRRRLYYHHHHHGYNLHSVWDTGIIERCIRNEYETRTAMEDDLFARIVRARKNNTNHSNNINNDYNNDDDDWNHWMDCPNGGNRTCTVQWAQESLDSALHWAYRNVDGSEVTDGDILSDAYYETRLDHVKERLAAAGVRLAATLEIALAEDHDDKQDEREREKKMALSASL